MTAKEDVEIYIFWRACKASLAAQVYSVHGCGDFPLLVDTAEVSWGGIRIPFPEGAPTP